MRKRNQWIVVTAIGVFGGATVGATSGAIAGTAARAPVATRAGDGRGHILRVKAVGDGEIPGLKIKRSRKGALKVRNLTYTDYIDVWVTLDDPDVDWYKFGTVYPRRWRKWKLEKGPIDYFVAGDSDGDPSFWEWGPRRFYMGSRFTWSLYN